MDLTNMEVQETYSLAACAMHYGADTTVRLSTHKTGVQLSILMSHSSDPRPRISEITDGMIIGMQGPAYTVCMLLKPVWAIQYERVRERFRERLQCLHGDSAGEFFPDLRINDRARHL